MDIIELEATLPHGFHDADLRTVSIDYEARKASLGMRIFVDLEPRESMGHGQRTIMRDAQLVLEGLEYFIIERPKGAYTSENRVLDVIGHTPDATHELPPTAPGWFAYSFYVTNWASNIYFSASSATLNWIPR